MRKLWLLVAAAASLLLMIFVPLGATKGTGGIRFETPSVADPIHTFGEPTIGVDPTGRVFVSGPTGTGTQRSVWAGSVDGGHSFRVITPGAPPSAIESIQEPPGGGDTDLNFDRAAHQYFVDLYALACVRVARTTRRSHGLRWPARVRNEPQLRPALARRLRPRARNAARLAYTGPTPLVYVEYNNDVSGGQWNKSTDGITYTNAVNGGEHRHLCAVRARRLPGCRPADRQGLPGRRLAEQRRQLRPAAQRGTPDASGNLTFLDAPNSDTSKLIHVADNLPGDPDMLFVVSSMDSARNLFVAWGIDSANPTQRQIFVAGASAASGWKTWTKPVQVSDGSTSTGEPPTSSRRSRPAGRAAPTRSGTAPTRAPTRAAKPIRSGTCSWRRPCFL